MKKIGTHTHYRTAIFRCEGGWTRIPAALDLRFSTYQSSIHNEVHTNALVEPDHLPGANNFVTNHEPWSTNSSTKGFRIVYDSSCWFVQLLGLPSGKVLAMENPPIKVEALPSAFASASLGVARWFYFCRVAWQMTSTGKTGIPRLDERGDKIIIIDLSWFRKCINHWKTQPASKPG